MQQLHRLFFGAVLTILLAGCTLPSKAQPAVAATAAGDAQNPGAAPITSPAVVPFPEAVLKITGPEEVVFDWSKDQCENFNIPDLPARAFRDADGQTNLILSMIVNYRMVGPDLNQLKIDCHRVFDSQAAPDVATFAHNEWLAAPYTEDGRTVYAVVHNEYHGWEHPGQCSKDYYYPPCWYNALTLAVSTDGGQTYQHAATPPAHLVASLPFQYKEAEGTAGPRNPSNIIKGRDGYYYMLANMAYYREQWVCLMRTDNLADPASWRFWRGLEFDGEFVDPYPGPVDNAGIHVCRALEMSNIGASMNESITYNTYLQRYVLVGVSADNIGGKDTWGYFYSFSDDLIHWTRRKLLAEMTLPWTAAHNDDVMYLYPTLLDPASESRNYETTGKTAYLYYTRHNRGQGSLDRDLVRVPVEFFPSP